MAARVVTYGGKPMEQDSEVSGINETSVAEAPTNWSLALKIRSIRRDQLRAGKKGSLADGGDGDGDGGGDGGDGGDGGGGDGGGGDGGDGGGDS